MKLHLGCGQQYLEGYVNIDFPQDAHTVQIESVADIHADLTTLRYPAQSVDEIRLQHVFEHFPRPVACGLLSCWFSWLKPCGLLHLEVPDFSRTARAILNPLRSFQRRAVAERHLFGSHEAPWAVHCEGYTPAMLKAMLTEFGFLITALKNKSWRGTYNIEVMAKRAESPITKELFIGRTDKFLRNFLIDNCEQEMRIHSVWMDSFLVQLEKGWAL